MDQEQIYEELNSLICECKEDILPTKWIHQNVIGAPYRVDYKQYLGWYTASCKAPTEEEREAAKAEYLQMVGNLLTEVAKTATSFVVKKGGFNYDRKRYHM